jgi:hypothetical protein
VGKFILLLAVCVFINPITIGIVAGFLSAFFPDVGNIRWTAPKSGPVYFDEVFKVGLFSGLLMIVYLLYRYRQVLGEQGLLFVCFIQLLILIIPAIFKLQELQYVLDEVSRYPGHIYDQDQLWIRIGWIAVSLLSACALFVLYKLLYKPG